jgi:hypothetical protein
LPVTAYSRYLPPLPSSPSCLSASFQSRNGLHAAQDTDTDQQHPSKYFYSFNFTAYACPEKQDTHQFLRVRKWSDTAEIKQIPQLIPNHAELVPSDAGAENAS